MKKPFLLSLLGALAMHSHAGNIETTLITATRIEQPITQTLAPSTVLDRESIELIQASDIYDLLNHIPGVIVFANGGPGSNATLFLRGTNSNHTLVLVNGQRIGSATMGEASIEHLSPDQIEKIEVVRGPRASLYGADAVGGVINIITRAQPAENQAKIRVGYGSNRTFETAVGVDLVAGDQYAGPGKLEISTELNNRKVNGFDSTQNATGANRDNDKYENTGGNLNLGYRYGDTLSAGISYMNNHGYNEYDNICMNSSTFAIVNCKPLNNFKLETTTLYGDIKPSQRLMIHATISRAIDSSEVADRLIADGSTIFGGDSFFETERTAASLQGDISLSENHQLSIGTDYYQDQVESQLFYLDENGKVIDELDNHAGFIQYQTDLKYLKVAASIREDDHEAYGNNTTGNAAIAIPVTATLDVILSYGTAFKAPTFNDMYWPDPFGPGNPDLKPEKSRNREIGLRGKLDGLNWQANFFRNRISDLIQWQPVDPNDPWSPWSPFNVKQAKIEGAELAANTTIADWALGTSYTYIDTEDRSTGLELLRRPKNTFSLMIDKTIGNFDVGATVLAYDSRYDNVANTAEWGGYTTTDLRLAYHPKPSIKFQLKLENLFDKDYTVASGPAGNYATEGRTVMFSVTSYQGF